MKILILSTSLKGGGGASAYKLARGLEDAGVSPQLLTRFGNPDDHENVVVVSEPRKVRFARKLTSRLGFERIEDMAIRPYRRQEGIPFNAGVVPDLVEDQIQELDPDLINVHFVAGLLQVETYPKLRRPIVWTLCDSWAFTGGCFLPRECDRYTGRCGACPQLGSSKDRDPSRRTWERKSQAWRNLDLTVVSPSTWLAKRAKSSSLLKDVRVEVIPTGVDVDSFRPVSRSAAREVLGLPKDRRLVLFAAWHNVHNKGLHFLLEALQSLVSAGWRDRVDLAIFGFDRPEDFPEVGTRVHFLGKLNDTVAKAAVYAAADVFVAPSIEDNFPNTVLEAFASGTPCVAFGIGGMPDLIDVEQNGYVAKPFNSDDLARGIAWVLEDEARLERLSDNARSKAEREYTLELYGKRYKKLFEEILERRQGTHSPVTGQTNTL